MDTVTYPDPNVAEQVSTHFSSVKIDLMARHPDYKEAGGSSKVIWAPVLRFEDSKGRELRRWTGWLPPEDFLAELRFVRATADFQATKFPEAEAGFRATVEEFPDAPIQAEALYWQGIAAFLVGGKDMGALRESWSKLAADHPKTHWGRYASVIEDAPG